MRTVLCLAAVALTATIQPRIAAANDGAAEVAAGGVRLRTERRVAMRTEKLFISPDKVRVEYEFVNESDEEVITEVAFPIPDVEFSPVERIGHRFKDFRAWADGSPIDVHEDARAFNGGRDVSEVLRANGLDDIAESLQHVARLPVDRLEALYELKLVGWAEDGEERYWPRWSVRYLYHWVQHFPPGKVIRIRHEYAPAAGMQLGIGPSHLRDACAEAPLQRALSGDVHASSVNGSVEWVTYILTTANTWKTPIHDFELTVARPQGEYVSFCWDGKVQKVGERTFRARLTDFVPKAELTVFFFSPRSPEEAVKN